MEKVEKVEIACQRCGQRLLVPMGLGDLTVTCPQCRHSWDEPVRPVPVPNGVLAVPFDDDAFYRRLREMERTGEPFHIQTPYSNLEEVPERMRQMFGLDAARSAQWVDPDTGAFVPGATTPVEYNRRGLVIGGMAATGAAVGASGGVLLGGVGVPAGAVAGAVAGLVVGAVTVALTDRKHTVTIEINTDGKLRVEIRPV